MSNVQDNAAHTCSYSCDRPQCIKAQRDELAAAAAQEAADEVVDLNGQGGVEINWLDGLVTIGDLLYAAPVTAAPTLDDELAQDRMSELSKLERDVLDALPAVYYMDPPDGGDVSLGEQVKRMAEDAALWRKHISTPAAPGIDRCSLLDIVAWWNAYTGPVDEALGEVIRRIRALIDASPKGDGSSSVAPPALYQHDDGRYALALGDVARHRLTDGDPGWHRVPLDVVEADGPKGATLNEQFGSAEGLDGTKGGSEARDAARYRFLRDVAHPDSDDGIAVTIQKQDSWGNWRDMHLHGAELDVQTDAAMQTQASDAEVRP